MLYLDLDAFRPYLGKARLARLVLKNGDAAVFKLDDLAAPRGEKKESGGSAPDKWNRQMVFGGPPNPIISRPFVVLRIHGVTDGIEAVCRVHGCVSNDTEWTSESGR